MQPKYLIVIAGPTGVGKTSLAIDLAKTHNAEIVSADSRQFYRELKIGTAKPSAQELDLIPHHFINNLSIHDAYDVGKYEKEVLELLAEKFKKLDTILLVGGSGLYINAICNGLDEFPQIDNNIRADLNKTFEENGLGVLVEILRQRDPDYFEIVDKRNPQRVIRALEICIGTGKPYSEFRKKTTVNRPFHILKIGLEMDRQDLYTRIDQRMDQMIGKGLFDEAEELAQWQSLNPLQTVGYSEIFGYLNGTYGKEEAIRLLKRNSRRYAKRQLTWFKRDTEMHWFMPNQKDSINDLISSVILKGSESK